MAHTDSRHPAELERQEEQPMTQLMRALAAFGWMLVAALGFASAPAVAQTVEYLHPDLLGSPLQRSNQAAAVVAETRYSAFGLAMTTTGSIPIGFAGAVTDPESGFVYLGNRYYVPRLGRFLGIDPVSFDEGNPQTFNLYSYASNNPYRYTDPDGRSIWSLLDWKDFL